MKITSIEQQQKAKNRVNVFVDEAFAFGIDEKLLVDFDLYKGKEVTEKDLERFKEGDSLSKCLDKAYRFLSYRMRSEKEMRDKLLEKYDEQTVEKAVAKLKEYNLINDQDFAKAWISSRKIGRAGKALKYELAGKGLAKEVIEEALGELSKDEEFENALNLVTGKAKYQNLDRNEAYQKIGSFLSRRGYSYEVIKKVLTAIQEQ